MIFDLQKAKLIKRISAFLFDFILFAVLAVGIAVLISTLVGYDARLEELEGKYVEYSEKYGIKLGITEEEYSKLTDAEKQKYEDASDAFSKDSSVSQLYSMIFSLTLVTISISILIAFLVLEFLIPLIFKNGQTLGKKIFSIAVMRTDGVKLSALQLVVRTLLGKYTIETMVPIFLIMMFLMGMTGLIGAIVILGLFILQIAVMMATKTNSMIHDLLAVTVAVDMNTQMIFDSTEEMIEYKNKKAAEYANRQPY